MCSTGPQREGGAGVINAEYKKVESSMGWDLVQESGWFLSSTSLDRPEPELENVHKFHKFQ